MRRDPAIDPDRSRYHSCVACPIHWEFISLSRPQGSDVRAAATLQMHMSIMRGRADLHYVDGGARDIHMHIIDRLVEEESNMAEMPGK